MAMLDSSCVTKLHVPILLLLLLLLLLKVVSHFKQRYPSSKSVLVAVTADAFEDTRDRCVSFLLHSIPQSKVEEYTM